MPRTMLRTRFAALALALSLVALTSAPQAGAAQIQFDGIEISGGYYTWSGQDFLDVEGGPRYAGGPMFRVGESWQVGVEGYYGESERQLQTNPIFLSAYGANALVRRAFGSLRGAHFFILARGGWTRLTSDITDTMTGDSTTGLQQDGWSFGPEIGAGFNPGQYLDIVWALGANWESFSECQVFGPDDFTTGRSCNGIRWGVRIGIALGRQN